MQDSIIVENPQSPGNKFGSRRSTARTYSPFTATISGQDSSGHEFTVQAVSTVVSPGGASFSLDGGLEAMRQFSKGQTVTVETSLATLTAEINGVWTEPKEPQPEDLLRPHIGMKLLDGQTWTQDIDEDPDLLEQ